MTPSENQCETCNFWEHVKEIKVPNFGAEGGLHTEKNCGTCYRFPPPTPGPYRGQFTVTRKTDWCGEWTKRIIKPPMKPVSNEA